MSDPGSPATLSMEGATSKVLDKLLTEGSAAVERELGPAMSNVESTQVELEKELRAICDEMERITSTLGQFGVSGHVRKRLTECKESLMRTKRTLTAVNARLGRLRKYDDAQRLRREDTTNTASSAQQA